MADVKREGGYYWVKIFETWCVCEWSSKVNAWWEPGLSLPRYDYEFDEIDERRITRD